MNPLPFAKYKTGLVNGGKHISLDVFALLPMIETT
jgi:hypothetical protein